MLTLGANDSLAASATSATTVNCTVMGLRTDNGAPPVAQTYDVLYQGQLANTVTAIYTVGAAAQALISSIHLFNTGATVQTVTMAMNGTAAANSIATIVIPANGWAAFASDGWTVYNSSGLVVTGSPLTVGGLGTPAAATTSLTAGSAVVQGGTLFQLPTGALYVGARFRWHVNVVKTAAGTATWTVTVKFGVNGTTADAAIATWTSGTNTAAIDQGTLIIECNILTLGASATAACTVYYTNTLTDVTGLGRISPVPGSTAAFNSAATLPYMHIDITAGASAVMTGVGMAEQIK